MALTVIDRLRALRSEVGTSAFDQAFRQLNKERLSNRDREKRKHFPPSVYQRLYDRQQGKCPYCPDPLLIPAKRNVIDHFDPNAAEFNHPSNLRLAHKHCNAAKSSLTPAEFAKKIGRNYTRIAVTEDEP